MCAPGDIEVIACARLILYAPGDVEVIECARLISFGFIGYVRTR